MKITGLRLGFLVFALSIPFVFSPTTSSRVSAANEKKLPALIKVTPQAPAFVEVERLAELAQRRARVAQWIGNKGFLVLFSGEPRVYANDVDYPFRQENNLFYLTHLKQAGATLVLLPGNTQLPEILFLPRRNPLAEVWTGHMYSPQEAKQVSGVKEIWQASELDPFLRSMRNRQPYRPKPENVLLSDLPASFEFRNGHGFEPLFAAAADDGAGLHLEKVGEVAADGDLEVELRRRRPVVHEVEVRLAVQSAKERIGQLENVDVLNDCLGIKLPKRQFHRLRGPQVSGAHGGR